MLILLGGIYINIDNNEKTKDESVPIWEKQNLTVNEAIQYSNIGENTLRRLTDEPNCPFTLFIGKKKLIKRKAFDKWIESQYIINT